MSATNPDLGTARRRPWDRFAEPAERAYRLWAAERMRPTGVLIGSLSIVLWLTMPLHTKLALGDQTPSGIYVIELGFLPALVATWVLLLMLPRTRGHALLWNMASVLLGFSGTLYIVRGVYDISQGGAAYTAVFFCLFLTMLRAPFRVSAVVGTMVTGGAGAVITLDIAAENIGLRDAYPAYTILTVVTLMVAVVALLAEHADRELWARGRLIEHQQGQLIRSRRLIRRYVPQSVADQIESGHDNEVDTPVRRRVTVMFSDIVGFTAMADRLDPEALTHVINQYLGEVADIVDQHGGTLNEFAGDGFMAIFGAPRELDPEAQVVSALAAARAVHARLPELHRHWERLGVDQLVQTRIGINTGVLSVGTFGSAGRATYTAIGLQTNIAARIQSHCEPGRILLSQTSWNLVKHLEQSTYRGEVDVKDVHFPIGLHEPPVRTQQVNAT